MKTKRDRLIDILSIPIHPRIGADYTEVVADHLLDNDVVPVVHGHWKSVDSDVVFECSNCACEVSTSWDYDQDEMWSYCPHCGAKMDEVSE